MSLCMDAESSKLRPICPMWSLSTFRKLKPGEQRQGGGSMIEPTHLLECLASRVTVVVDLFSTLFDFFRVGRARLNSMS